MHPEFSPDGKWLAYFRRVNGFGFQIFKISVSKPREEIHLADFQHACNVPRWSPDGKWLLYQERDSVITVDSVNVGVWRLYKVPSICGAEQRLTHKVAFIIYEFLGKEVRRLVDQQLAAEEHSVRWDGFN